MFENLLRPFEQFAVSPQLDSVLCKQFRNQRRVGFVPSFNPFRVSFVDRLSRFAERRLIFIFRCRAKGCSRDSSEQKESGSLFHIFNYAKARISISPKFNCNASRATLRKLSAESVSVTRSCPLAEESARSDCRSNKLRTAVAQFRAECTSLMLSPSARAIAVVSSG